MCAVPPNESKTSLNHETTSLNQNTSSLNQNTSPLNQNASPLNQNASPLNQNAPSLTHPFEPVYDQNSRLLILGSFPSVKSRELGFYYSHPRNRFWKLIADLTGAALPVSIDAKRELLLEAGIALWDVCGECEISASADASIKRVAINNLSPIFATAKIEAVFTNGRTAHELYMKHLFPVWKISAVYLPSTSPANAAMNYDKLKSIWQNELYKLLDSK